MPNCSWDHCRDSKIWGIKVHLRCLEKACRAKLGILCILMKAYCLQEYPGNMGLIWLIMLMMRSLSKALVNCPILHFYLSNHLIRPNNHSSTTPNHYLKALFTCLISNSLNCLKQTLMVKYHASTSVQPTLLLLNQPPINSQTGL